MLISILIGLLIFAIIIWVISIIPMPNSPIPLKAIVMAIVAIIFIIWLLRFLP